MHYTARIKENISFDKTKSENINIPVEWIHKVTLPGAEYPNYYFLHHEFITYDSNFIDFTIIKNKFNL